MSMTALKIIEEEQVRFLERNSKASSKQLSAVKSLLARISDRISEEGLHAQAEGLDDGMMVTGDENRRAREVEFFEAGIAKGRALRQNVAALTQLTDPEGRCITTQKELHAFHGNRTKDSWTPNQPSPGFVEGFMKAMHWIAGTSPKNRVRKNVRLSR